MQPARPIASASTTRRMDVGPTIYCLVGRRGVVSLRPCPRGPRIISTAPTSRCPRNRNRSRASSSKIRSLHTAPSSTRVDCGHVPPGDRPTVCRCCFPLPSSSRRGRDRSLSCVLILSSCHVGSFTGWSKFTRLWVPISSCSTRGRDETL